MEQGFQPQIQTYWLKARLGPLSYISHLCLSPWKNPGFLYPCFKPPGQEAQIPSSNRIFVFLYAREGPVCVTTQVLCGHTGSFVQSPASGQCHPCGI